MILSTPYLPAGGEGAWWLACWTAGREVWVQDLAGLVIVLCFWAKHFTFTVFLSNQNPVVQRIDISIRWWITIQRISVHKTYCAIHQIEIYPVKSAIQPLNNQGQMATTSALHNIVNLWLHGKWYTSETAHQNLPTAPGQQFTDSDG